MNKEETQEPKKRVALYIRVSTEEQAEKYGIDLQRSALEGLVKSKGETMVLAGEEYVYVDDGVSGTVQLDERPVFSKLKEDLLLAPIDNKPFDVVAVYKIDRFARSLKILLDVVDLFKQQNVEFVSANESIDTSTPFGKAMLSIIGVIAELERDTIIERTRAGTYEAFEKGVVIGNSAPYGYTKDERKRYKILEPEAKVVREIFQMFVNKRLSVNRIKEKLQDQNILSPRASAIKFKKRKGDVQKKYALHFWAANAVRRILSDEIYIGRIYGNKVKNRKSLSKEEWKLSSSSAPVIVDVLTFEKAQKLLAETPHIRSKAKGDHVYILSGLLKCECCYNIKRDGPLGRIGFHGERKVLKNKKPQYYYKCSRKNQSKTPITCTSLPLPAKEIEEYITKYVAQILDNPVSVFEYQKRLQSTKQSLKILEDRDQQFVNLIEGIPAKRDRLREQHKEGICTIQQLKEGYANLDAQYKRWNEARAGIQKQLYQHSVSEGYLTALDLFAKQYRTALQDLTKDRTKLSIALKMLIEEIVVYTRKVRKTDVVAGRKKPNQQIPNRLHIKLKLPQEIINQIATQKVHSVWRIGFDADNGSGSKNTAGAR